MGGIEGLSNDLVKNIVKGKVESLLQNESMTYPDIYLSGVILERKRIKVMLVSDDKRSAAELKEMASLMEEKIGYEGDKPVKIFFCG